MNNDRHGIDNSTNRTMIGSLIKTSGRSLGLCALVLGLAACGGGSDGGGSDGGGSNGGGSGPSGPTIGESGANTCLISNTNQINFACYFVPGNPGEEPSLTYTAYLFDGNGTFQRTDSEDTYDWHDITTNSAQYDLNGETTHFDWDDTTGYSGNGSITQTDGQGTPEQDELIRPLRPLIGQEAVVTNNGEDGTLTGSLQVFEPKLRTISIPGAGDTIKANNAIMAVQKVALFPDGSGLVNIEYYAPEVGPVAQVTYLGCPDMSNVDFRDDLSYYKGKCADSSLGGKAILLKVQ